MYVARTKAGSHIGKLTCYCGPNVNSIRRHQFIRITTKRSRTWLCCTNGQTKLCQTRVSVYSDLFTAHVNGSPYSITERRVPELIPVLGSRPAGNVSHKPGGRLPLLSARSYPCNSQEGCYQFCCLVNRGTMGVNSLPKTVSRQRRDCDLNPSPSAPESSTLTTRLPSHPHPPHTN